MKPVLSSINEYLLEYQSKDYGAAEPEKGIKLDCSLGVNTDLLGNCVFDRLHDFHQKSVLYDGNVAKVVNEGNYAEIKYYPHDDAIKQSLANWYIRRGIGCDWLTKDNFILGNGSYEILCNLNLLCLTGGKKVLGHAPQFTAYVDNVYCTGSGYDAVKLEKANNYKFDTDAYLERMSDEHSMFIIENPNNPTGQMIPLADLERVAKRALELNKLFVVDEAYAEYLPDSATAIHLTKNYPNVMVTRSFSKGWGMAGLRIGYAVMSTATDTLKIFEKIELGFNCDAMARALAKSALDSKLENPADPFGVRTVTRNKAEFTSYLNELNEKYERKLRIAETHRSTPIMMIYRDTDDENFDLKAELLEHGLLTVSCATYEGLDKRAVRLMLPEEEQMPLLLEIIEECMRD